MPGGYDGSGNFIRSMNWTSDAAAGIKIEAGRHDTEDDNFAKGLSRVICVDGQSAVTADIPFNGHKITNLGAGINPTDAVILNQLQGLKTFSTGITLSGSATNGWITFTGTGNTGISWPAPNDMFFGTDGAGTFIWNDKFDASGNTCMDLVANTGILKVTQKDDGANIGPQFVLTRKSATPAAGDGLGYIAFTGPNTSQANYTYADMYASAPNPATGAEEGRLDIRTGGVARAFVNKEGMNSTKDFTATSGVFLSATNTAFLASSSPGAVYFRPNGRDSSTGQVTVDANGGITTPGGMAVTGAASFGSVSSTGTITSASTITSSGGNFLAGGGSYIGSSLVMLATTGASTIYLRPQGAGSGAGEVRIASSGAMTMTGGPLTVDAPYQANVNGTTLAGGLLQVSKTGVAQAGVAQWANANGNVGGIYLTGTTTSYNTTSDETLKDFIGLYDPLKAIEIIRADPVRDFHWKVDGSYAVGWGAQTSHAVSPDLASPPPEQVEGEEPLPWGIDQGRRTPYLWAALSHALDKIEALEARIAVLEGGT